MGLEERLLGRPAEVYLGAAERNEGGVFCPGTERATITFSNDDTLAGWPLRGPISPVMAPEPLLVFSRVKRAKNNDFI